MAANEGGQGSGTEVDGGGNLDVRHHVQLIQPDIVVIGATVSGKWVLLSARQELTQFELLVGTQLGSPLLADREALNPEPRPTPHLSTAISGPKTGVKKRVFPAFNVVVRKHPPAYFDCMEGGDLGQPDPSARDIGLLVDA